jgi:CDGSH-type Zn-finger protein
MADKPVYPGNSIMLRPDGPLVCKSDSRVIVEDANGVILQQAEDIALCRCGGSATKPFCDGSHRHNGFSAEQEFSDERGEDISGIDGDLSITVKENAMLSIKGPVTIFSRSGNSVTTRTKAALCRCGHSAKKPFCDISHKKDGFTA